MCSIIEITCCRAVKKYVISFKRKLNIYSLFILLCVSLQSDPEHRFVALYNGMFSQQTRETNVYIKFREYAHKHPPVWVVVFTSQKYNINTVAPNMYTQPI